MTHLISKHHHDRLKGHMCVQLTARQLHTILQNINRTSEQEHNLVNREHDSSMHCGTPYPTKTKLIKANYYPNGTCAHQVSTINVNFVIVTRY